MSGIGKRALDVVVGVPAAIVATPVLAGLALAVLVTSGWPPLIRQIRVGASERPIPVWKLRTMRRGTPVIAKSALLDRSDVRYTPLGPWLRRFSLDELPQLWNVLCR